MPFLRTEITEFSNEKGKETERVQVRAASKVGAIMTARARAISLIPFKEQEVVFVNNKSNERLLDQWEVVIRDKNTLEDIGQ